MKLRFGTTKKESTPTTNINWINLSNSDLLNQIKEDSNDGPVMIFKHSTRCPTSSMALNRIERSWDGNSVNQMKTYFLDLISYREISNQIASEFGIMHQSPQVLIISDGKAIYDDSHFNISFDNIKKVVSEVAA